MPESPRADEHGGEEQEVVAGVDQRAGGQGARLQPHRAEDQADHDQQQKRSQRMALLISVNQREEQAGGDGGGDHSGQRPLRMAVFVQWARQLMHEALGDPIAGCGQRRQQKSAEEYLLKKGREGDADAGLLDDEA